MNEIAAKLGEVGLPAPLSELAARDWDAVVVGGGHNGLTAAAYLARAGSSVLVLERRERLGGACTLERPFPDERFVVSPCAYVVGLLDELVISELDLRRRGFQCFVADPNLWVPFEDGTVVRPVARRRRARSATFATSAWSPRTSRATGPMSTCSTRSAASCAPARATRGWARRPTRAEIEELLDGEQTMIDVVFSASIAEVLDDHMSDQRLKDALFGQGVIAAYGGPKDAGTASIKLMHYQGDLEGQGPVWGYVKGGMGMVSFALADAAQEAGAVLACGVPVAAIEPEAGVVLEDGTRIRARTVLCNADPKVALRAARGPGRARRLPRSAWRTGRCAARWSSSTPRSTRCPSGPPRPGETWPARATIDVTGGLEDAQRAFEACERGEPAVGFGEVYIQTGYDPSPAPAGSHLLSVFGQYAPYELAEGTWDSAPRGGRAPVHRPDRPLRARLRAAHRGLRGARPARHRGSASASPAATSSRARSPRTRCGSTA